MLKQFFKPSSDHETGEKLYGQIAEQSRRPEFFLSGGVEDTVDGRFDLLVLNAFLVLRRLREGGARTSRLTQALFDIMFEDLDEALREIGIGDLSVGRKIKDMAEAFYGRIAAYEDGLKEDTDEALCGALKRNLFRGTEPSQAALDAMAAYVRRQVLSLDRQEINMLAKGEIAFEPYGD